VDRWYCERLDLAGRSDVGVMFNADGRRWSFFRDGVSYRTQPALKKGPPTVRQLVGQVHGAQVIVLALRPRGTELTQISVTVMPLGADGLA
jgi:hypothetical protein